MLTDLLYGLLQYGISALFLGVVATVGVFLGRAARIRKNRTKEASE